MMPQTVPNSPMKGAVEADPGQLGQAALPLALQVAYLLAQRIFHQILRFARMLEIVLPLVISRKAVKAVRARLASCPSCCSLMRSALFQSGIQNCCANALFNLRLRLRATTCKARSTSDH